MGEVLRVVKLPKFLPLHINLAHEEHLALALFQTSLLSQVLPCTANKMLVKWKMGRLERDTEIFHLEEQVVDNVTIIKRS